VPVGINVRLDDDVLAGRALGRIASLVHFGRDALDDDATAQLRIERG
jgi:hypothetical protein